MPAIHDEAESTATDSIATDSTASVPSAKGVRDTRAEAAPYDHLAVEAAVRELWDVHNIYRFDADATGPIFSIDTPPPYVSASHLHVGHVMSYSQPDFIVRYRRMRGDRIFYPMGFDDNGLPTERYVEKKFGVNSVDMPRGEFVAMCLAETTATAARYEELWRRVGLSVDWAERYSTIDARCQQTSQGAFIKLYEAGHVRRGTDPIMWCPECQTSLAQADIDDLERTGKLYEVRFATEADSPLTIATTRPELLPACVAMYFHPTDERYQHLLGSTARVPIFGQQVPILTDESVDPDFGTGLMMVCTFGDAEDVAKWRRDLLDLRIVVAPDGRLTEAAGEYAGLQITQARSAIVNRLANVNALGGTRSLKQVVGVHERCATPVEFQIKPQWFIAVRDKQQELLARAHELTWIPEFMRRRLEDWINGLKWDWNISRQRRYGVPFPVWFCADCEHPVLAALDTLPVDPLVDRAPVERCPACGSARLEPEADVMDTWMTSSLSPQVNDGWAARGFRDGNLTPMSLRVQAFEIIRTWLFYTVVQSHLLFDRLPWTTVMISGWGLNEQGKKISKRDLDASTTTGGFNRYVPDEVIDRYGADALRLWATKARVGNDLRYNEKDVRAGRKLAIKLWNVGRFLEMHAGPAQTDSSDDSDTRSNSGSASISTEVDRWMLSHLADAVSDATAGFDGYDYMQAYLATSKFFWSIFCDRYIEMIKDRFNNPDDHSDAERDSARAAMHEAYHTVLGLFAPFAPFITEHQYQQLYRHTGSAVSLHLTAWPTVRPHWRTDRAQIDDLVTALDTVRALRAGLKLGGRTQVSALVINARSSDAEELIRVIGEPLRVASLATSIRFGHAETPSGVDNLFVGLEL